METGIVFAIIGSAVSAIFGGIGSSVGSGLAGRVATGVIAEKPQLFTKTLILTALPGSQAIYGLLIAFLIQNKALDLGEKLTLAQGQQLMLAGILMGLAACLSGIYQGKVAAGGVAAIGRDESLLTSSVVLAALVETSAILGLLMAFLIFNAV